MNCTIIHRELMFDPSVPGCFRPLTKQEKQKRNLPQEPPFDVFRNDPQEKLFRISCLNDDDGSLTLAIDSIRHFFYGDRDKLGNALLSRDSRSDCGIDLYYELSNYLLDNENWCKLLATEPLHICYAEFVKPLRLFIADKLQEIEDRQNACREYF